MPEADQGTNAFLILRTQHQKKKLGRWKNCCQHAKEIGF